MGRRPRASLSGKSDFSVLFDTSSNRGLCKSSSYRILLGVFAVVGTIGTPNGVLWYSRRKDGNVMHESNAKQEGTRNGHKNLDPFRRLSVPLPRRRRRRCAVLDCENPRISVHEFPTRWNRILSVVVLGASVRRSIGSPRIPETSEIRTIRTLRFSETALDLPYGHSLILYTISPLPILSVINMVRYIQNLEEFEALMAISNTKLVVVDFTAGW